MQKSLLVYESVFAKFFKLVNEILIADVRCLTLLSIKDVSEIVYC